MLSFLTNIFAFLLLVGVIIIIHEGGHFLIGRLLGIKILEFSIGFGPKIYEGEFGKANDKFKFTLRLLPLGGFVKPLDKNSVTQQKWDEMSKEEKDRSYTFIAKWKKFLMIAGGPVFNFILAFIIYLFCFAVLGFEEINTSISEVVPQSIAEKAGLKANIEIKAINGKEVIILPEVFNNLINKILNGETIEIQTNQGTYTINYKKVDLKKMNPNDFGEFMGFYFSGPKGEIKLTEITPGDIAEIAGVKPNDILVGINGQKIYDINTFVRRIAKSPNKEIELNLLRNKQEINIKIVPRNVIENGFPVGKIGIKAEIKHPTNLKKIQYNLDVALKFSIEKTIDNTLTTLISIKNLIIGKLSLKSLSGPISIAEVSGKTFESGWKIYLITMASISIAIGVFNLLPIPVLDGGYLIQFLIEYIIGKDIPEKILYKMQYYGLFLLMSIFVIAFINDITKYFL
jgi:regulator of sigma E protease